LDLNQLFLLSHPAGKLACVLFQVWCLVQPCPALQGNLLVRVRGGIDSAGRFVPMTGVLGKNKWANRQNNGPKPWRPRV
jgi:hypothetical protein